MLDERIAVGHSGDEIGDTARARRRSSSVLSGCAHSAGMQLRFGNVAARTGREIDLLGIVHDAHDAGMAVHAGIRKSLMARSASAIAGEKPTTGPVGIAHVVGTNAAHSRVQTPRVSATTSSIICVISRRTSSCTSRAASSRRIVAAECRAGSRRRKARRRDRRA